MSFIPLDPNLEEDFETSLLGLQEFQFSLAQAINEREIGVFSLREQETGKQFVNPLNPQEFKPIKRKVLILKEGLVTRKDVPHRIEKSPSERLVFTSIQGMAINLDTERFLPISGEKIGLEVEKKIVKILPKENLQHFKLIFIVLEYMKILR